MPYRRGDFFRRALAGLLVVLIILLPVARLAAVMVPVSDTTSHAALTVQVDERPAFFPVHSHSGSPCEGPDGLPCCTACGFAVGNLPSIQSAPRRQAAASLRFLISSISSPDGLTSAPDLPPPRHIV